jgi:hypothetical protein
MTTSASATLEMMTDWSFGVVGYSIYSCGMEKVGDWAWTPSRRRIFRGVDGVEAAILAVG